MSWTIRPLQLADAAKFSDLMIALSRESPYTLLTTREFEVLAPTQHERCQYLVDSPCEYIAVAANTEDIVGFVGSTQGGYQRTLHSANLMIGVRKAFWREGIATALMQDFWHWVDQRGIKRVELSVIESNHPARNFYLQQGFQDEGLKQAVIKHKDTYLNEIIMAWLALNQDVSVHKKE